jgi:hypothetical protein
VAWLSAPLSPGRLVKCEMGLRVSSSVARYCASTSPWRSGDHFPTTERRTPHSSATPSVGTRASGRLCSCTIPATNFVLSSLGMHTEATALTKRATVWGLSSRSSASASSFS